MTRIWCRKNTITNNNVFRKIYLPPLMVISFYNVCIFVGNQDLCVRHCFGLIDQISLNTLGALRRISFFIHAMAWQDSIFKGTQDWEFCWRRFWNLRYFFVSYVKILRLYKKKFLIGPLLGEVRLFRVVLGLRGMKKNVELGQKICFFFFNFGP